MKKLYISLIISVLGIVSLVMLSYFEVINKELVAKISLFLTAIISFVFAYIISQRKRKNGLSNGLIIGISIAMISLLIHFFLKTNYFDVFYLRGIIFMTSGGAGGIIGVNKVKETF